VNSKNIKIQQNSMEISMHLLCLRFLKPSLFQLQ